jgi:histone deacetylase 1/2
VFLVYSPHHKGDICFDRHTNRTIISRHVVFDEGSFPFAEDPSPPPFEDFEFLDDSSNPMIVPFPPSFCSPPAGSPARGHSTSGRAPVPPCQEPRAASSASRAVQMRPSGLSSPASLPPTSQRTPAAVASPPTASPAAALSPAALPSSTTARAAAPYPMATPSRFGIT